MSLAETPPQQPDAAPQPRSDLPAADNTLNLTDVVSLAVAKGDAEGNRGTRVTTEQLASARSILNKLQRAPELKGAVEQLCGFVERFPQDERFQALVARAMERVQDSAALDVWRGIDARFPASRQAYLRYLRWVIRLNGEAAGRVLHESRFPETPETARKMFMYACGLLELKAFDGAEEALSDVLTMRDASETTFIDVARVYLAQRHPTRAREIAQEAAGRYPSSEALRKLLAEIEAEVASVSSIVGEHSSGIGNTIVESVYREAIASRSRKLRDWRPPSYIGRIVQINGSLGSGGAERQLVNTILGLQRHAQSGIPVGGIDVIGPVNLICRSTHSRAGADFYVAHLRSNGVQHLEYSEFPEFGGRPRLSCAAPYLDMAAFLPHQMREGILRLSDALRYIAPDIVHIWQDGSVLAAGAAALIAGVPRIVIGVRTLPPTDRFERNKPEYEANYRALIRAEGVTIVANSRVAARRYEQWLSMPEGSVRVIPNGIAPVDREGDAASVARFNAFDIPQDAFVVGSVMRFDANKRPMLWLDVAKAILARHQNARFIMVGDGPLFHRAEQHAKSIGIADKVMLVGRSSKVGYWLSKMDAFLLLSRHEGLPNVVIEAEMVGVPVISTPAGGTAEAMKDNVTGTLLDRIDDLDIEQIAEAVIAWRREPSERQALADRISHWATDQFSLKRMLERSVAVYLGNDGCDDEIDTQAGV